MFWKNPNRPPMFQRACMKRDNCLDSLIAFNPTNWIIDRREMYAQARDGKLIQRSFYNYVDQILTNFDPLPHRVGNCGHFPWYVPTVLPLVMRLSVNFLMTPPPLIVNVRSDWMTPKCWTFLVATSHVYIFLELPCYALWRCVYENWKYT